MIRRVTVAGACLLLCLPLAVSVAQEPPAEPPPPPPLATVGADAITGDDLIAIVKDMYKAGAIEGRLVEQ